MQFGDKSYPIAVDLQISSLMPRGVGVELAPLVRDLSGTFPNARSWSTRMRRALAPLAKPDAMAVRGALRLLAPDSAGEAVPT